MDIPDIGLHGAHLRSSLIEEHGRRWVDNAVARDLLRPLWRTTLVETRRFFDPWTRSAAASLISGPDAVITGETAAVLHGFDAVSTPDVHVLLPYQRQSRHRPGLVFHRGSFFADDVEVVDELRVMGINRVVADLLCSGRSQDGLALADQVLRRAGEHHQLTRRLIEGCIRRRADPRGTVIGLTVLALASPRSASAPESWIRMMLIEVGFPPPEVNWELRDLNGRLVYELDLAWPALRVVLEYDGYESHVDRREEDAARQRDLEGRGWIVVRAEKADLSNLRRVENELRSAFRRRGYAWGVPERKTRRA